MPTTPPSLLSRLASSLWRPDPANPTKRRLGPLLTQDIRDTQTGDTFLRRWGITFGGCAIYLHHMLGSDPGRDLHNHPWEAAFLILRGGYVEERNVRGLMDEPSDVFRYRPGSVNRIRRDTYHRVSSLLGDTWTLGLVWGREGSDWGFWVPGKGYVPWRAYEASKRA